VIAHALGCISGYAKMICDLSEESKLNKTPYEYWHKHLSSKNKYEYTGKIKIVVNEKFAGNVYRWLA
jgi:thiaminase